MTPAKILIAGAGIGGLTAAIACAQHGLDVQVFEQAAALGEVGAGVQVSPAGLRVLDALGLKDQVMAACFNPVGREMLVWNTGYGAAFPIHGADLVARYGYAHVTMHRADLHAILVAALEAAKPGAIAVNARVMHLSQTADQVWLHLRDGRAVCGNALVGADGLHSVIRDQLFGASKAEFTGGIAWRGVIPIERLPHGVRSIYGQNWIGPNGHVVVYPIRRGELINVVAHVDRDDWQVESWTERGTRDEMAADFAGWHPTIQALIDNIDEPFKWALFLHPTMKQWSVGRATLLGDACHPTLPYLASGANMAIEDGYVLARCLGAFGADIQTALRRYEALRIPRTTDIVNASAANLSRYHNPDLADPDLARAYIDREAVGQQASREWLYTYDATRVPLDVEPNHGRA